jgi:molecular chaperone GrpE
VFDNLDRALKQETTDEAYKRGVEMTFGQFVNTLTALSVSEIGAAGDAFDPEKHNAVMHIEDDSLGKNIIAEVFERGFMIKDKVIRHAMVKVAN